ncbi:hypothetical protein ACF07D_03915 [Leucobacter sp. NPDC015123]|uniref:hypothetical protein n=1 Tax=Leucobacter sp. NPDC015123 TaxID=3364129 RepID=UPI0036F48AD7
MFDKVLSRDEAPAVLAYVRSLLAAERFHGRVLYQSLDRVKQWHLEVDRTVPAWFAVSEDGDSIELRDGALLFDGEAMPHGTEDRVPIVEPASLGFPESRYLWGGSADVDWPVLLQRVGKRSVLITFEHGRDPSMRSTMVIDTELGVVTRILNVCEPFLLLVDIEIGRGIERLRPDAYPELEVIYPEF